MTVEQLQRLERQPGEYDVTREDLEAVEKFLRSIMPISKRRVDKHRVYILTVVKRWLRKPLQDVQRDDLNVVWQSIKGLKLDGGEEAAEWTKRDYRFITKRFFRWLKGEEFVKGLKIGTPQETVGPEDILTDDELTAIRKVCRSVRDRAMCETLYEGAFRPHEFLGLRKSDVAFDEFGAIVYIRKGKTGPRRVRVVNAAPLLANLVENHPMADRDAPLWVEASHGVHGTQLKYIGLAKVIKRWITEAGIEKNVTAYIFRHTRLTHLAKFLMEAELCIFAGWRIGSKMPRMYIHLSGRDVDEKLLSAYGLKKSSQVLEIKAPKRCARCGFVSSTDAETCSKCGMALTIQAAMAKDYEAEEAKRKLSEILKLLRAGAKVDPDLFDVTSDARS